MKSELFLKHSGLWLKYTKMFKTVSNISGQPCLNCHQNMSKSIGYFNHQISCSNSTSESTTCWNRENIIRSRKFFISFFLMGFKYFEVPCFVSQDHSVCLPSHDMVMIHFKKPIPNQTTIGYSLKRQVSAFVTHDNIHISHLVYRNQPGLVDIPISSNFHI